MEITFPGETRCLVTLKGVQYRIELGFCQVYRGERHATEAEAEAVSNALRTAGSTGTYIGPHKRRLTAVANGVDTWVARGRH